jgi:hypothetical protein
MKGVPKGTPFTFYGGSMIRKYPTGDNDRDARIANKRDGPEKKGSFGAIVYTYRLSLESHHQTNMKPRNMGRLYHPVNSPEEAAEWLEYYRSQATINGFERRPLYESVWFIPS